MRRAVLLAMLCVSGGAAAQDMAAAGDGKGRLVFYRTGGMHYGLRGCPLFEDRPAGAAKIGALGGGQYVAIDAEPGPHRFAASGKLKHALRVVVATGETVYVRCQLSGFPGSPKLLASHADEFERFSKDLEPVR